MSVTAIDKLFLDPAVKEHPIARELLRKIPGVPVIEVPNRRNVLEKAGSLTISQGKRSLWVTQFLGPFLKPCPGTSAPYVCCNYWVLNLQRNCPLDCSYCILQDYLNLQTLTLFVNLEKIPDEMEALQSRFPGRLLRVGTGELTDSLVLDPLTNWNNHLIRFVSDRPLLLELKTKTSNTAHLPDLQRRNVVVSCSMNPPDLIRAEEHKTASLDERLAALQRAVRKGYRIGIHLDPIIEIPDWQMKYEEMIRRMTAVLDEEDVAWISLGTLRFPGKLKKIVEERFPENRIFLGEFAPCPDGKMRYLHLIRSEIYQKIYAGIRRKWREVFVYLCMEHPFVWEKVMGRCPAGSDHLDLLFHQNIARRFPDLGLPKPEARNYGAG